TFYLFFFSSRRRHTRFSRDWSSDVCSSDLDSPYMWADELVNVAALAVDAHYTGKVFELVVRDLQSYELYFEEELLGEGRVGEARSEERRVGKECRSRWAAHGLNIS